MKSMFVNAPVAFRYAVCTMVAVLVLPAAVALSGTITITQRESTGVNDLFAGAGGAVETHDMSGSSAAPTGPFSFSDSASVEVTESDPFSTGAADASGSVSTTDNVAQPNAATRNITANASANSTAQYTSGTGTVAANSRQRARTRVRFTVGDDDAMFFLTGNFTPAADSVFVGDVVTLELRRPFTVNKKFDIDTAGPVNEFGTLTAGQTWEFIVHINDMSVANAGDPFNSDSFNWDLTFTVVSVPEPAAWMLAVVGVVPLAIARQRRRRVRRT
mgnify:CR=1 FL=1